ncbi:MAG: helix-hairpin-helix domain-containing protein, partial [Phycisphaeraceae bacterium]|nr:helix-hairpin-helix domain-containing protein [Phycisphaeraceae bacterium]
SGSIIDGRVDLNRADLAQLELLPGVGPATAARIVAYREQIGGFRTVDELSGVRGIGPRTMERLRERVMVRAGVPVERSVPE